MKSFLLEDVQLPGIAAPRGLQLNDALKRDLEAVLARHGGELEFIGHPTTTLEELFLRIIAESKAHPGRRYMPEQEQQRAACRASIGKRCRRPEDQDHEVRSGWCLWFTFNAARVAGG